MNNRIKPSPELVAVTRRWTEAIRRKDEGTLRNLLSSSEYLTYVGTAVGERWNGDVLRHGFGAHVSEIPDFTQEELHVEAFECGTFGWAVWNGALTFPNMDHTVEIRTSFVFLLESGSWKIVQHHGSNPSRNVEVIGVEHAALDDLVAAARDGFHLEQREGMASVMFTDIAESSTLADALGDNLWAGVVQAHLALVRQRIEDHGGRLVKSLGDGTMSTFTTARAALGAASSIQRANRDAPGEPPLQLRVGIHTGDVVQTEDDFFGTVVNKAARVAAAAEPDGICVSDATRVMAGSRDRYSFSDPFSVALKGLPGDHRLFRMHWQETTGTG